MHQNMNRIVKISILAFWLVMLGLLIERTYLRPSTVIALDVISEEGVRTGDDWFGIYQQGRKIGYAHTRTLREADTYHLFEESELDILALGSVQRVKTVINSYAARNFQLKYFDFTLTSDLTSMTVKGAVVGKKLLLDITSGGQTRNERIHLADPPYLSPNIKPALVLLGLEQGKRFTFPLFNPATMNTAEATITVESRERIKVGDQDKTVYKLKESFQGMEAFSWITDEGETLKEESALGYVLLRETRTEALKRDKRGPAVDIIALTMIPSDPIKDWSRVRYLKARLRGAPLKGFQLQSDGQSLSGEVIDVTVQDPVASFTIPYAGTDLQEYLLPSALIQSDDARIKSTAARVLGGQRDSRQAARTLNEWVYTTLEKKPVVSIPSALEILEQRAGDCNEHTTLFTALARAAGIPARMAGGIVYMDDGFYYHAWPEVWLGQWTAIDPTFNQFPADATHIRFVIGNLDQQTEIMRLVGKLKVDVLEYQ
jgi:transglutaminase-like putative cysteine protease